MTEGIIPDPPPSGTKTCPKCRVEKTTEEFNRCKSTRDGLQSQCKACRKAYREANREKIADRDKVYYEANREKIMEQVAAWQKVNREKVVGYKKAYREANPEVDRAADHHRRARKRNSEGTHDAAQIRARSAVHGDSCIYCASNQDLHLDHIKPLSQGGSNWPANLAPACESCNLSKHAKWGQDLVAWGTKRFGAERVKSWPFPKK